MQIMVNFAGSFVGGQPDRHVTTRIIASPLATVYPHHPAQRHMPAACSKISRKVVSPTTRLRVSCSPCPVIVLLLVGTPSRTERWGLERAAAGAAQKACNSVLREGLGSEGACDVLVFLPGLAEIRQ